MPSRARVRAPNRLKMCIGSRKKSRRAVAQSAQPQKKIPRSFPPWVLMRSETITIAIARATEFCFKFTISEEEKVFELVPSRWRRRRRRSRRATPVKVDPNLTLLVSDLQKSIIKSLARWAEIKWGKHAQKNNSFERQSTTWVEKTKQSSASMLRRKPHWPRLARPAGSAGSKMIIRGGNSKRGVRATLFNLNFNTRRNRKLIQQ